MENLNLVQVSWKRFYFAERLKSSCNHVISYTISDLRKLIWHGLVDSRNFVLKGAILSMMRMLGSNFFHWLLEEMVFTDVVIYSKLKNVLARSRSKWSTQWSDAEKKSLGDLLLKIFKKGTLFCTNVCF